MTQPWVTWSADQWQCALQPFPTLVCFTKAHGSCPLQDRCLCTWRSPPPAAESHLYNIACGYKAKLRAGLIRQPLLTACPAVQTGLISVFVRIQSFSENKHWRNYALPSIIIQIFSFYQDISILRDIQNFSWASLWATWPDTEASPPLSKLVDYMTTGSPFKPFFFCVSLNYFWFTMTHKFVILMTTIHFNGDSLQLL